MAEWPSRTRSQVGSYYRFISVLSYHHYIVGMLVAVKVDEEWHRAQVIFKLGTVSDTKVGNDFLVKLVDIGKVEVVNTGNMKILEKCFPALPVQVESLPTIQYPPHYFFSRLCR